MRLDDQPHAGQGRGEVGPQEVVLGALDVDDDQAAAIGESLEVLRVKEAPGSDAGLHPVQLRHPAAGLEGGGGCVVGVHLGVRRQTGQPHGVVSLGAADIENDLRVRRQGCGQVGMKLVLIGPDQAGGQGALSGGLHIDHAGEGAAQHAPAILVAKGLGDHPGAPNGQDPKAQGRTFRRGQAARRIQPRAEPLPDRLKVTGHPHSGASPTLCAPGGAGSSRPQAAPRVTA